MENDENKVEESAKEGVATETPAEESTEETEQPVSLQETLQTQLWSVFLFDLFLRVFSKKGKFMV